MYHQQHDHQPQPPPPQTHGYSSNAAPVAAESAEPSASASNLDHALLESLFYSEMAMFDSTTVPAPTLPTEHDTPHTIAEKEILRDFGVGGTALFHAPAAAPSEAPADAVQYSNGHHTHPQNGNASSYSRGVLPQQVTPLQQQQQQQQQQQPIHHHPPPTAPLHHQAPPPSSAVPQYANNGSATYAVPPGAMTNASTVPPATTPMPVASNPPVYMDTQATATAAAAAAAMLSGGSNGGMKVQSTATIPGMASSNTTHNAASLGSYSTSNPPHPIGVTPQSVHSATNGIVTQQPLHPGSKPRVQVPKDRARQLVDQFATLASRLGIDLPDSVLQSLTSAAAKNDPTLLSEPPISRGGPPPVAAQSSAAAAAAPGTAPFNSAIESTAAVPGNSGGSSELAAMAPTVMELRNMAEDAIAAVTQSTMRRTASVENLSRTASSQARPAANSDNKPTYSKRRKKPRLSDCEAKLAQLKAENEQLKRHLQNVSNKAHKFDKEKEAAGKQIARFMHDPNAGPREMEASVRKFSDMYSDYGVNRQQELSFHLDQLQRLVNPTNFTKMGLWTLGQSGQGTKKNPIAGILVKELDITPQQGRKILDQSEKIRTLCDNLKEAHALLAKLKYLCEKKTQTFQDRMNKCTEILTSKQVVKLICWINDNGELLETVCPGWGTEHIQSKK